MDPILAALLVLVTALIAGLAGAAWSRSSTTRKLRQVHELEMKNQVARLADEARAAAQSSATAAAEQALSAERAKLAVATATAEQAVALERNKLSAEERRLAAEREAAAELTARAERRELSTRERETALAGREKGIAAREDSLDRKLSVLDERDSKLRSREEEGERERARLRERETAAAAAEARTAEELARIAGLTPEAAKAELFAKLDGELTVEHSAHIAMREKALHERAKDLGIEIVARAVQRYAAEHTAETTANRIQLPSEEYKGRIIGKEGRNIKAFEQASGVDVIIDEAPDIIFISCFDPIRREVAVRTLKRLIEDGRIQPARIEEELTKVRAELDRELVRLGEEAAFRCEVSGLHPQVVKLLGKLHFRTSYGQNVLVHTQEVAFLCGAMAADMGLDPRLGRRCGLLHDVGKAIDHEQEGSHPQLGYEALKRYGESETVANAALAHHEGHDPLTPYTVLAAAADAISAARPGARRANLEQYLKRLAQLEDIAVRFPGVQKAYAIQAGRELRVIVNQHTVADAELTKMGRDITRAIADQVAFPGEVKVTLIRETRHIAVAR
jgi:ribonucrease Y